VTGVPALRPDADILAVVVARIGDTLLATPALRALKEAIPQGRLTVLAHARRAALLQHLPFIDRLGTIGRRSAFWRGRLPSSRHDMAFVWGHDRELVDYGLRRAQTVVAFAGKGMSDNPRLIGVSRPQGAIHAVHERLLLPAAAGVSSKHFGLAYAVVPEEALAARHWLGERTGRRPLIGIQPVSFPTKAHRDWPVESFAGLLQGLAARFPDAGFVVLGDQAAVEAGRRLQAVVGDRLVIAAGMLDLRRSAALIAQLDLYVGVDTGPTHIAGALGVPMVALYHCSYPGRNLVPLDHPACHMIEHPATGTPDAGTERSMAEIPVETVQRAVVDLLERGQRP
jgi:heptosyltransferase-3